MSAAELPIDVPVLIVGGGPTGLALSLALSAAGVASLLVDKHPGTSTHPKATVVNPRTMELFRQWDIAGEVERVGIPAADLECVLWSTTLAGFEIGRLELKGREDDERRFRAQSPVMPVMCPQDVLEPVMRSAADARPHAELRYGSELVDLVLPPSSSGPDRPPIVATVRGPQSERSTVRCRFLVGCDGRSSRVRERLGIELTGRPPLGDMLNIYFRADLRALVADRLSPLYWIVNPDTPGVIITLNGTDRWLLNLPYSARTGETIDDYPDERCRSLVARAIGDPSVAVEILDVQAWQMTRLVADRFARDGVFLAGDAAHQFPPTGGHGMNSGIQDAHNLAWKLAAVLGGWAGEGLLDTYDAERRPVAEQLTNQSVKNAEAMRGEMRPPPEIEHDTDEGQAIRDLVATMATGNPGHFVSPGLALGLAYRSTAVIGATDREPDPDGVERYRALAAAGHRSPHAWLTSGDGPTVSTLDLFRERMVLLGGAAMDARRAELAPLDLDVVAVGADVEPADDGFEAAYALAPDEAVLVRPDGYIMWRGALGDDPAAVLTGVLTAGLSR